MISFIIPAHDEEHLLGETLAAIKAAAATHALKHEIVVVDDASTDRTATIATAGGARVVPVALRKISAVRNAGAAVARGERLIFVDADSIVSAALLGATLDAFAGGAIGGGARLAWQGYIPWWTRPMVALTDWVMWLATLGAGCYLFTTRAAFDAVGGFDEQLYVTEELTFSVRLKRQGRFVLLREPIMTSGRKLRTYSPMELARVLRGGLVQGRRDPRYLSLWYGKRRNER